MVFKEKQTLKAAAAAFSVCPKIARKWIARHRADGPAGLLDHSSRPRHSPRRTKPLRTQATMRLREQGLTHAKITQRTGLSEATLSRCLRGQRVGPRITAERRDHVRGAGWGCVPVCINDHSRVAYVQVLPDEKKQSAVALLEAAVCCHHQLGVFVQRVMTDNGSCHKSAALRKTCHKLGLRHIRTPPHAPKTNAKPNASSSLRCANGLTPDIVSTPPSARLHSPTGCADITGIGLTDRHTIYHPSLGSTWGTTS